MKISVFLVISLCTTRFVFAQTDPQRIRHFNLSKNIAIQGYDATSYFDNKPKEGSSEFAIKHKGITYLFASKENLNKFRVNATQYEPAYGGWCAYAMGESGEKVKVDPETYKIINGKLYLFYNFWGNNTLTDWNENEKRLKEAADRNWGKLIGIHSN